MMDYAVICGIDLNYGVSASCKAWLNADRPLRCMRIGYVRHRVGESGMALAAAVVEGLNEPGTFHVSACYPSWIDRSCVQIGRSKIQFQGYKWVGFITVCNIVTAIAHETKG